LWQARLHHLLPHERQPPDEVLDEVGPGSLHTPEGRVGVLWRIPELLRRVYRHGVRADHYDDHDHDNSTGC
jgi:hypothetical protein